MFLFFFNDTATTEIYTLSLHDALPILFMTAAFGVNDLFEEVLAKEKDYLRYLMLETADEDMDKLNRSEEHTSELQSRQYLVCRLLLEKQEYLVSSSDLSSVPPASSSTS